MCINMQASHASMNTYGYMHTEDIIRLQISLRMCKKYIRGHRHADFIVALAYNFDYSDPTCYSGTSTRRPRSTRLDQESTEEQFDWLTSSIMMNDSNINLDDSVISCSSVVTSPTSSSPGPRFRIGLQLYTPLGFSPRTTNIVQQGIN